jgi:hypothetical protein
MPEYSEVIRVTDQSALEMIRVLAKDDLRTMGDQVAWLIRQEYVRRYNQVHSTEAGRQALSQSEAQ